MRTRTKLVYGIGINDLPVCVGPDGKLLKVYVNWCDMIRRCVSEKYHKNRPTYIKCSVSEDWLLLSNFKKWHDANYVEGFYLDKDILVEGNKTYSPETCRYVPSYINNLFLDSGSIRGEYPIGVSYSGSKKKFRSYIKKYGKQVHLGTFNVLEDAIQSSKNAKEQYVIEVTSSAFELGHIDNEVRDSILERIKGQRCTFNQTETQNVNSTHSKS